MRSATLSHRSTGGVAVHGFLGRSLMVADRKLDETKFAKPLPWIGLFVAAASIFLDLLLFLDFLRVIRKRKNLLTCRWFPLNAATLTILAIATKLPVDLNTPMPGKFDQLSKLTGNIVICTVMENFILSLVHMDPSTIFSNVVALTTFVVTVIVNICIQMCTGVIYIFWLEHIVAMVFMLFSLFLLCLSALALPTNQKVLDDDDDDFNSINYNRNITEDNPYHGVHQQPSESENELPPYTAMRWWPPTKLEELMKRYWLLALTHRNRVDSWPIIKLSTEFSFCSIIIIIMVLGASLEYSSWFCTGDSDYGWSTQVVFYSQVVTIMVGTHRAFVSSLYFNAIWDTPMRRRMVDHFRLADHWIKQLDDWKYGSLLSGDTNRYWRKMEYAVRSYVFHSIQQLTSESPYLVRDSPMPCSYVERFVLQGEENFLINRISRKDVEKWIEKGRKKKPTELIRLLKNPRKVKQGFGGIARIFDRTNVGSFIANRGLDEPANCWAMAIVTLLSLAMTIPSIAEEDKKSLMDAVRQGLKYIKFVEYHLDCEGITCNARKEAEIQWKSIEFYNKWFDEDLQPQALDASAYQKVKILANIGKQQFNNYIDHKILRRSQRRNYGQWSGKAIAAYSMYKIAENIICTRGPQLENYAENQNTFHWIRETISDTISACLTNLPRAIYMQCINNDHLHIEEKIRNAACILGETIEDILPIFKREREEMPNLRDDQRPYIDKWIEEVTKWVH